MNKLVSVIIPIYKVEPYLIRCLDSILNQTYKNIEIILVDDGSPDNCPQICDEYAAKDNRIIVIHQENGGLSAARNTGLDIAKGEYISFVDSDDWVHLQYIEVLLTSALKENADIIIGNHIRVNNSLIQHEDKYLNIKSYRSLDALNILIYKAPDSFVVSWSKLYKKELFNNVRFPLKQIHEDEFTTYQLFFYSKKISYTSKTLYYYFQRPDSIMGQKVSFDNTLYQEQQALFFEIHKMYHLSSFLLIKISREWLWRYWKAYSNKSNLFPEDLCLNKFQFYANKLSQIKTGPLLYRKLITFFSKYPKTYLYYRKYLPHH